MRKIILGFFIFISYLGHSQSYFRLSGTITNPPQDYVTFLFYPDWVSEPKNYTLKLSADNSFIIELPLKEVAYCDLSFGEHGLDLLKIEPDDKILVTFDNSDFYNSLNFSGEGSEKWIFQLLLKKNYELEKDWDMELSNFKGLSQSDFFLKTSTIQNQQLTLLNHQSSRFSTTFNNLQKADITGRFKLKELGYLNSNKIAQDSLVMDWTAFSEQDKVKSIYLSQLLDILLENLLSKKNPSKSLTEEYDFVKTFQGKFGKGIVEKVLATKLLDYLNTKGIDEEFRFLVEDYTFYSDSDEFKKLIAYHIRKKERLEKGKFAPNFILKNQKGKLIELKDFRGRNLVLGFYEGDCFLCLEDIKAMEYVKSFYKVLGKKDLDFVFINLSSAEEFRAFLKQEKPMGIHLNGFNDIFLQKNYNVQVLPNYLVIDKNGRIVSNTVDEPRLDNGRSLIELLGKEIYP